MIGSAIPVFYDEKSMRSSQYTKILQGVRSAAGRHGLQLYTVSDAVFPYADASRITPVVIAMSADMPFLRMVIDKMDGLKAHVLLAGCDSEQFGRIASCVTPFRRAETEKLIRYLFRCGKKHLALVGFGSNSINDNLRCAAAVSAAAALGSPFDKRDIYFWTDDPRECVLRFLKSIKRYDAAVCPNDIMSVFLTNLCAEHGIRVPNDLFAASFGNMSVAACHSPSITSMTMDLTRIGEQAFYGWRFLINHKDARESALKILVPGKLVIRESTANMQEESAADTTPDPGLDTDLFYEAPDIAKLVRIENCVSSCDETSLRLLSMIMDGASYEKAAGELFIGGSTLRYRMNRIYEDIGVSGRKELVAALRAALGRDNPFRQLCSNG